jgi:putative aldouronate transport system permease protein
MKPATYRFNTGPGRAFDVLNVGFLTLLGVVALLPFLYVLAGSFASEVELTTRPFFVWPNDPTAESYRSIFATPAFAKALATTIGVTVVGTALHLLLTVTMAYPLSKRDMPGRKLFMVMIVFTMVFSAGMIPTFLIVKNLGLLDTYWALILPAAISPFSLIIIRNFFQNLPAELMEAATIDGASEAGILWRVVLPLSKPVLATFALFYAVAIWNDFMSPLLYLNDSSMWTLQMFLRQVTVSAELTVGDLDPNYVPPSQGIKFAVIVVATVPILLFYPFLQKHFAKGMLIGSVKG